jgi:DNA-binding PucR family transcriptional regulator
MTEHAPENIVAAPPSGTGGRTATLASVIEALGAAFIEVAAAPRGLDVSVAEPVIFDQLGGPSAGREDLLLAVGVDPAEPEAVEVLEAAAAAGAAAVVVKRIAPPTPQLVATAQANGVALLTVPGATNWGQLLTLLRTTHAAGRAQGWTDGAELRIGDLFALANAVAAMVGGATTIEDMASNVLAFSTLEQPIDQPRQQTILGRKVPDSWMRTLAGKGVFKRLYGTRDIVRMDRDSLGIEAPALTPRLAIAIRAGGEALGSIWVVEGAEPLGGAAEEALRGAAAIAALHLLHHRASGDIERQRRAELVRSLLDGSGALADATALGLEPSTSLTVMAFAPRLGDAPDAGVRLQRIVALITLYAEVYRRHADALVIGQVVYVLLPTPGGGPERLRAIAEDLAERTAATVKTSLRAGIGAPALELRDVHRSRSEADEVLRVLARRGERVGHVDALRGQVALLRLEDLMAQEPLLRAGKVEMLLDHDERRGSCYVETLRAYLDAFGDIIAAAQVLNVHRNTFRYRLARLLEVSGIDLEDPDDRLITHLQLRFLHHFGKRTLVAPVVGAAGARGRRPPGRRTRTGRRLSSAGTVTHAAAAAIVVPGARIGMRRPEGGGSCRRGCPNPDCSSGGSPSSRPSTAFPAPWPASCRATSRSSAPPA